MKKFKFSKIISVTLCMIISLSSYAMAYENKEIGFNVNKNGETYGTGLQADILGYEPDLMLATGENDVLGYVRVTDLDEPTPSSPEEAYKIQKQRIEEKYTGRYIPLYESDGKTVIGRFLVAFDEREIPAAKASTDYTYGNIGDINVGSYYSATTKSGIKSVAGGVRGVTTITADRSVNISWLGAQAKIFKKSNNSLVRSTSFYYNTTASNTFSQDGYHGTVLFNTEYYSKGSVKTWNPSISDYWTTGTFASPSIKP